MSKLRRDIEDLDLVMAKKKKEKRTGGDGKVLISSLKSKVTWRRFNPN